MCGRVTLHCACDVPKCEIGRFIIERMIRNEINVKTSFKIQYSYSQHSISQLTYNVFVYIILYLIQNANYSVSRWVRNDRTLDLR